MTARLFRVLLFLVAVALAMPIATVPIVPAHGQERADPGAGTGLLRFLFQREPEKRERAVPREQAPRRSTAPARRSSSGSNSPAAPPPAPEVEKAEDAARVLVVGDFLASGLADGLASAFAENTEVVVVDRSNGSSGLVRDDYYDWPGRIGSVIEEEEPDVVVVMIGSNDRQQLRVDGNREEPRSEPWIAEYERRVSALADAVLDRDLPLVWVGNLPFRSGSMSSDMIAFNDIYRRIVTDAGGEFVDVWDGFVDEKGEFVVNGPDMNGQPAQLRSSDGINVTRPGRRKIAFYVEKPLNRLLDSDAGGTVARAAPGAMYGPFLESGTPREIDRTAPMAIDELDLDNGASLLGEAIAPARGDPRTAAERLTREGVAPQPQPGRADYFSLRPASPPAAETTASTR
jgi:hypothetical protein